MTIVNENTEWSAAAEARLFHGILKFKPAGYNKHFNMALLTDFLNTPDSDNGMCACALEKFSPTADEIWSFLQKQYAMEQVDQFEPVAPFSLEEKECEFFLPGDFSELMKTKEDEIHKRNENPPSASFSTPTATPKSGDNQSGKKGPSSHRKRKDSGGSSSRSSTPAGKSKDSRKS